MCSGDRYGEERAGGGCLWGVDVDACWGGGRLCVCAGGGGCLFLPQMLDTAWALAQTGNVNSSHPCPIPEDPRPITGDYGVSVLGERSSQGQQEGRAATVSRRVAPQANTRGAGMLLLGGGTWSTAGKPHHTPAGKALHQPPVLEAGLGSPADGNLSLYLEVSREMLNGTRVCSKQASCLPAPPSLGLDVTASETSSWGRRRTK